MCQIKPHNEEAAEATKQTTFISQPNNFIQSKFLFINNNQSIMKRIYSTLRPNIDHKSYLDWITKCDQKLSVSTRGLIAFTSSFCLNQARPSSSSYHVYLADINTPYQPYLVVDSEYEFTIVEWDPSGTKLLVCDINGCATIYTSKDYLISDWKPYFKQVFAAETFISAAWYHLGIISTINVANQNLKNPSNHLEYSDKVQQTKCNASLRLFGGKSAEGCLLVSRTGLVCCLTLIADGSVDVVSESLAPIRTRIEVADICHNKDGSFIVATSAGSINSTISFYQLYLSMRNITLEEVDLFSGGLDGKRVNVTCKQFNSFHLNIMAQILNEWDNTSAFERISHIKFITKDSPDDVLVEVSGQNLSLIELWELEPKKKSPIHCAILDIKATHENIKPNNIDRMSEENGGHPDESMKDWSFKGNYITDKDLVTIQTPRFKIFGTNRQLNMILLAYKDSTVCCMRKEDLQPIYETLDLSKHNSSTQNTINRQEADKSPYKSYPNQTQTHNLKPNSNRMMNNDRKNRPVYVTDIQLTSNQAAFIAIDSMSQLHAVRLPPLVSCQDRKDQETYLQYILEYCLITGNDWWDVMVCARQDSIESICDKFHDAYERQPKHMQRKYFNRQLMIRASLYRCLNDSSSLCKSSDCHTMIMLNSIASTLKSVLRSQDQDSPSEYLSNFLRTQGAQQNFFSSANVISKINEKEFHVETNLTQCLQPLSQWIADLAIFLVVSMPHKGKMALPGAGLAQNKEALEIIRELLIIIKIWGLQSGPSLPVVLKLNDQVDVLAILFRLISVAYVTLGNEPEDSFIEECIQLRDSISISQFEFSLNSIGVASPLLYRSQDDNHLVLEFFKEPSMPDLVVLPKVEGAINMNGNRKIDVVRNISLGAYPVASLRHCTRCTAVSLSKPSFESTRSWEQRWISSCVCGGSWAQSDKTFVNTVGYSTWLHQNSTPTLPNHGHQLVR